MPTPVENVDSGIDNIWSSDYVQKNPTKAYKNQYNAEYLEVATYLNGGVRPNPINFSKMGKGLVQLEDARRALTVAPPPPPPPPPPGAAIPANGIISAGGVYSGGYTGTVRITTAAPITLTYATLTNKTGGSLIACNSGLAADLTVDHCVGVGGDTVSTSGFFIETYLNTKKLHVKNCSVTYTRGIEMVLSDGADILVTRNKHKNIQGSKWGEGPVGSFIKLRVMRPAKCELSWNEITNEYNRSYPTDIFSIYHTSNVKVLNNMIFHQSLPGNSYNTSDQGSITIDASGPGPGSNDVEVGFNQVVDAYGIVGYNSGEGSFNNNFYHHNRIMGDRYLPNGQIKGNGWGSPLVILPGFANNHAHDNIVGYIDRDDNHPLDGFDATYPTMAAQALRGAVEGGVAEAAKNTYLPRNQINAAAEQAEWPIWLQKLADNNISVGAE